MEDFADLSLDKLRTYRRALRTEESRVSYWRRLLQARLDLVQAYGGVAKGDGPGLRSLLASPRVGALRTAFLEVRPANDMPPLPDLQEMWTRVVADDDAPRRNRLLADLSEAERTLSAYRKALHHRLDSATGELVRRYRANPALCLEMLPTQRHSSSTG
jgi:hypothetical protein